ncbi:hypothetical protein [Streptomyces sp. NPDC055210]
MPEDPDNPTTEHVSNPSRTSDGFEQNPEVIRVIRPLDFEKALEAAKAAWALDYGVSLRTVLVRDSLESDSFVERYEVTVFEQPPLVDGESEDATWGPDS